MAKILIVDDDEDDRLLLSAMLGPHHQYYFAGDGHVAKNVLDTKSVDIIITDLAMPSMNGLRLIREVRAEGCTLPIIAISGVSSENLDLAAQYGAGAVLSKPVDAVELTSIVDASLAARRRRVWDDYSRDPG